MKKFFSILGILCLTAMLLFAQSPQSFKYQAVLRGVDGAPHANLPVSMQISIVAGSANGETVYAETHSVTTSDLGLVNLEIGRGATVAGTFAGINWGGETLFVKVEFDPAGGSNYTLLGASQLLSVPYALYAERAGNTFSGEYGDLKNTPNLSQFITAADLPEQFSGEYGDLKNTPNLSQFITANDLPEPFSGEYGDLKNPPDLSQFITADDLTPAGGIPQLRVSQTGDTLSLGKDNYVILPGISASNHSRGTLVPEILDVKVINVGRHEDGNHYIDFEAAVKSMRECQIDYNNGFVYLYNEANIFEGWVNNNTTISTGLNTWKVTASVITYDFPSIPNGDYILSGLQIGYGKFLTEAVVPISVSGNVAPPKPVFTDVVLHGNNLTLATEESSLSLVRYTITYPDNSSETKTGNLQNGNWNSIFIEAPDDSKISNIIGIDTWGQETDAWTETFTVVPLSSECDILSVTTIGNPDIVWTINGYEITAVVTVPRPVQGEEVVTGPVMLSLNIEISPKATISPNPSELMYYSNGVHFTVVAENGTIVKTYIIRALYEVEEGILLNKSVWRIMDCSSEELVGEGGGASGHAVHAIDGDNNTYWHTRWMGSNPVDIRVAPEWLVIDLRHEVTPIMLVSQRRSSGAQAPRKVLIEGALEWDEDTWDAKEWFSFGEHDLLNADAAQVCSLQNIKPVRFIKYTVLESHGGQHAAVAEIDVVVLEAPTGVPFDVIEKPQAQNGLLNKSVWRIMDCSSEELVHDFPSLATSAIDGNNDTFWHTRWSSNPVADIRIAPEWLVIDLRHEVTPIMLVSQRRSNQSSAPRKVLIEGALEWDEDEWDAKEWFSFGEHDLLNEAAPQVCSLQNIKPVRFIKYTVLESHGGQHTAVAEIDIIATEAPDGAPFDVIVKPIPQAQNGFWYTIQALEGDFDFGGSSFPKYFKTVDANTWATTFSYFGVAHGSNDLDPEWDLTDPDEYTFILTRGEPTGTAGVYRLNVTSPTWSSFSANESTYNEITGEFLLNFVIDDYFDYASQRVHERAYGRRTTRLVL